MATYNGERFVAQQLRSILTQLSDDDEVIVVDDCSMDGTVETVRRIGDRRITVHMNDRNRGEVFSFSRAMSLARNDFLFLSDQDDVWIPGRASAMKQRLVESGASVVSSNVEWMNTNEEPIDVVYDGVASRDSEKHLANIVDIFLGKTNYFGCAMALRREFVKVIAPIPSFVESHDLWIALASNLVGSNTHLDERTLRKRKHADNATSTVSARSLYRKLRSRVIFAASLIVLFGRSRHFSRRPSTRPLVDGRRGRPDLM
jgi:glycosyltransferase involved in cell wall biosynthesis